MGRGPELDCQERAVDAFGLDLQDGLFTPEVEQCTDVPFAGEAVCALERGKGPLGISRRKRRWAAVRSLAPTASR